MTAAVKAEHERLMAQMREEEAARQAAFWTFRTPPPFSPEVAAFIESLNEARDQAYQEVARVAAEKEREQARAAAEQKEKARAAEEQRQKAEARRAALLERESAAAACVGGRPAAWLIRNCVCCISAGVYIV